MTTVRTKLRKVWEKFLKLERPYSMMHLKSIESNTQHSTEVTNTLHNSHTHKQGVGHPTSQTWQFFFLLFSFLFLFFIQIVVLIDYLHQIWFISDRFITVFNWSPVNQNWTLFIFFIWLKLRADPWHKISLHVSRTEEMNLSVILSPHQAKCSLQTHPRMAIYVYGKSDIPAT